MSLIILHKSYLNIHDNTLISTLSLRLTSQSHIILSRKKWLVNGDSRQLLPVIGRANRMKIGMYTLQISSTFRDTKVIWITVSIGYFLNNSYLINRYKLLFFLERGKIQRVLWKLMLVNGDSRHLLPVIDGANRMKMYMHTL